MNDIYWIVGGILLLITGRKLYWFFVALVGFAAGLMVSATYVKTELIWVHWLIALGCGILGGFLAVGLQKLAVGVAGFIAGGYGLIFFLELIGVKLGEVTWPFFVVGGIIGALLVLIVFEYALIFLSSIAGATLVTRSISIESGLAIAVFLALALLGVLIQWAAMRAESKEEAT